MSNLTNNTTALQDILEAVNALPEAGSGLPDGITDLAFGSYTAASNATSFTIEHGITNPRGRIIWDANSITGSGIPYAIINQILINQEAVVSSTYKQVGSVSYVAMSGSATAILQLTATAATDLKSVAAGSGAMRFAPGRTYNWIVWE